MLLAKCSLQTQEQTEFRILLFNKLNPKKKLHPQLGSRRNLFNFVTQSTKALPLVSLVMTNKQVSFVMTKEHTTKQTTTRFTMEIPLVRLR